MSGEGRGRISTGFGTEGWDQDEVAARNGEVIRWARYTSLGDTVVLVRPVNQKVPRGRDSHRTDDTWSKRDGWDGYKGDETVEWRGDTRALQMQVCGRESEGN